MNERRKISNGSYRSRWAYWKHSLWSVTRSQAKIGGFGKIVRLLLSLVEVGKKLYCWPVYHDPEMGKASGPSGDARQASAAGWL